MDDIVLIIIGVVLLLLLMFAVSKFLMREQSYDKVLEQKKQEFDNTATEQKPGKQKRRHVYSKHNDKSKTVDDKQKSTDEKPLMDDKQKTVEVKEKSPDHKQKLTDVKEKSPDHKQKLTDVKENSPDHKQKLTDVREKSPDHKQKVTDVKETSPDHKQKFQKEKAAKSALFSNLDASCKAAPSPSKKHVEIESKVETIEPDGDLLSHRPATPELGLSSHPSRSILVNKDEKSLVIEAESVPETFHPRPGPVDELDKKHQEEGRRSSGTVLIGDAEVLKDKAEGRGTPSPPAGKANQKKKKKGKAVELGGEQEDKAISFNVSGTVEQDTLTKSVSDVARKDPKDAVSVTVKMLESGEIEEQECKALLKALESKGFNAVSSSKKKKDEDYAAETLKKTIRDLETSLQKEKLTAASSEAQVKQLRDQLALEQQKSESLKKSQQSQTAKQLQEINDARSRLESTLKVREQERLQLQSRLDSVQAEVAEQSRLVQTLMEENGKLKATAGTSPRDEGKQKANPIRDENIESSLEDNIKHFEDQFEEMVAKQEMEKLKEDNEVLVHSLRSQIAELNVEILEKDSKIDVLQSHSGSVKRSVDEPIVCEKINLTGQQNVGAPPPSCLNALDEIVANGTDVLCSMDDTAFLDMRVLEVEELLQKQRQKNDDLRRRNWKVMEALSEMENELQKANHAKGKSGTSENAESLVKQLHSVQREKGDLERLRSDQEKLVISLQRQIADLQKQIDDRNTKKTVERVSGNRTNFSDHESEIIKLEESLNRQIQKNDDLRRRNWKTMEALSEMEKRLQNVDHGSERGSSEVDDLRDQLRSLQKDKVDLDILNKGLSSNLATCVHQAEEAEKRCSDALNQLKNVTSEYNALKTSTDGLNDSQLKRITQLETFISEKNGRIKQLEDELLAAQNNAIANDISRPLSLASADPVTQTRAADGGQSSIASSDSTNRKEVMVLTRIQETSKWDMSQLVLELDTKTAEVEILQSLLDQRENSLHDLQEEKSKTVESVHHMRQALKEKDAAIHSLQSQLKNSAAAERSVSTAQADQNSKAEVLLKKDSEMDALKSEVSRHQLQIETSESEYEKIRAQHKSLEEQVKHYQDVLADTAGMLSKLQLSVENEESKWLQKVAEAEEKTAEAVQEANRLHDELETLRKSS